MDKEPLDDQHNLLIYNNLCGKTLVAKATAKELGFPLFQLDVGSLFGRHVGESEQNMRTVIETVDSVGRCVLFID